MTKSEKIILFTLAAMQFTHIMDFMIMMPLGPQLIRLFHISAGQFSMLVSAYSFSAFVSGILTTFIINRLDRKQFLVKMYLGFILGTVACGLSPEYYSLLASRLITGFFGGVQGAIILSIVSDLIPFERRGQAMGIIMTSFSIASVFGVPFGIFLATQSPLGWHAPFYFLALVSLPLLFLVRMYIPAQPAFDKNTSIKHTLSAIQQIFKNSNYRMAMILGIVTIMGHFSIIPFLSPYMVANVGLKESELPYMYLIGGALTLFTSPIVGKWSDKFGKFKVFSIFIFLYLIPVFTITNLPTVSLWIVLVVVGMFFIFSSGRMIPSQAMITGAVTPIDRGIFMSLNSSIQQLSTSLASFIGGMVIVKNPDGHLDHYAWIGYFSLFMAIFSWIIANRLKTSDGKKYQ